MWNLLWRKENGFVEKKFCSLFWIGLKERRSEEFLFLRILILDFKEMNFDREKLIL